MLTLTASHIVTLAPVSRLPAAVLGRIRSRLTFPNPAHQEAQKHGFSTWNIPQQIQGYRVEADVLIIPRGFTVQLVGILQGAGIQYRIDDRQRTMPEVDFEFLGERRDYQVNAVKAMAPRDFGTLTVATGAGKTVMALELIAHVEWEVSLIELGFCNAARGAG